MLSRSRVGERLVFLLRTESVMPNARSAGLAVEDLGDEILIYDDRTDTAHCLSVTAARVWRACDGATPVVAFLVQSGLSRSDLTSALNRLDDLSLLDRVLRVEPARPGISRRQAVGRMAAAAMGPLIVSVAAPTAMAIASRLPRTNCQDLSTGSSTVNDCATGTYCCSGGSGTSNCCNNTASSNLNGCCATATRCCYVTGGDLAGERFCRPTSLGAPPAAITCTN
jgi:hypothetical protein